MQTKTGYSSNPDARQAVAEAASGFSSPHGLLIMADYKRLPEISELLRERFPNTEMIGTSGTTYLNTKSSDKHLILVAFGSDAIVKAGIIRNLSSHPVTDIPVLKDKLREAGASRENSIVIEYCTNDEERLVTTIDVALSGTGVPLVGGSVFGYGANEVGRVTCNGRYEAYRDKGGSGHEGGDAAGRKTGGRSIQPGAWNLQGQNHRQRPGQPLRTKRRPSDLYFLPERTQLQRWNQDVQAAERQ